VIARLLENLYIPHVVLAGFWKIEPAESHGEFTLKILAYYL
jgi:hypothetical protein